MKKYAAFLRGINVGGKNVIKMTDLQKAFEEMGFQAVRTYIQSGNVLFQSDIEDKNQLEEIIEKFLSGKFKYKARALIRSKKDIENTIKHFPVIFQDTNWKHNVIFLSRAIDSKNILNRFEIRKDIEEISYYKGVLFWSAKQETITRSKMLKLSSREEYQEMTVRNMNTTRKILELMNGNNE
jgi:uncharacterized protein (DUF1697 family)